MPTMPLYFVAHNVVRCKETDGQVHIPAFVDGGQEDGVQLYLKYGLTFFAFLRFPVTPSSKRCAQRQAAMSHTLRG